jgi:hypothetical protein
VAWCNTIRGITLGGASDGAIGGEVRDESYSGGQCRLLMTFYKKCVQEVKMKMSGMVRM